MIKRQQSTLHLTGQNLQVKELAHQEFQSNTNQTIMMEMVALVNANAHQLSTTLRFMIERESLSKFTLQETNVFHTMKKMKFQQSIFQELKSQNIFLQAVDKTILIFIQTLAACKWTLQFLNKGKTFLPKKFQGKPLSSHLWKTLDLLHSLIHSPSQHTQLVEHKEAKPNIEVSESLKQIQKLTEIDKVLQNP